MKARIKMHGHPYDGAEVIITHAGVNRHPFLDVAYDRHSVPVNQRPVSVIILGRAFHAENLFDTVPAKNLVVVAE